jgi:hypothetical protein
MRTAGIEKWVGAVFLLLLAAVFGFFVWNHNAHFQECDSSQVYDALDNFPLQSISFTAQLNNGGSFISPERAQAIINMPLARTLMKYYESKYSVANQQEFDDRVVRALTRLNPLTAFRVALVSVASQIPLPHALKSFVALPTGTTYSPMPGFLYGLLTSLGTSYDAFMSRNIILTLLIFIISVYLVFRAARKLGVNPVLAALIATMMLFSISLYSYAYHLGSTVWNIFATAAWMFFFVKYADDAKRLKKMSLITAACVFFNYLVLIYWVAFAATQLVRSYGGVKDAARAVWSFAKSQWVTLVAFVIILIFFYPPGQSYRGIFSIRAVPLYAYDIVLNFFGFYNHNFALDVFQFVIAAILLAVVAWRLFGKKGFSSTPQLRALKYFSFAFIGVYLVLLLARILAFYPSRHILGFAPIVFILLAAALQELVVRFRVRIGSLVAFWVMVIILGLVCLFPRMNDMNNNLVVPPIPPGVSKVYIYECTAGLADKDWNTSVPVEIMKPVTFAPQEGQTYLYLSQYVPFATAMDQIKSNLLAGSSTVPNLTVLSSSTQESDQCFIGFYPKNAPSACGGFGETNGLYKATFTTTPQK